MEDLNLKELWRDSRNWKGGLVYSCSLDPRILVPKKTFGWTINFGRTSGWIALILTMVIFAGIVLAPFYPCFMGEDVQDFSTFLKPFGVSIVVIILLNIILTNYVVRKQGGR